MRFAQAFVLLVLGLASLEQAVAKCNPKKDTSCCLDKLRTKRPRTEEETRETRLEIAIACV